MRCSIRHFHRIRELIEVFFAQPATIKLFHPKLLEKQIVLTDLLHFHFRFLLFCLCVGRHFSNCVEDSCVIILFAALLWNGNSVSAHHFNPIIQTHGRENTPSETRSNSLPFRRLPLFLQPFRSAHSPVPGRLECGMATELKETDRSLRIQSPNHTKRIELLSLNESIFANGSFSTCKTS